MRKKFASDLYDLMKQDKEIILITADLGFVMFDKIRDEFPDQYYNVGSAEQVMMDMAVGLSMEGKHVVVYSITPFLLFRAFESIRNYIDHEKWPVVMVGSGRGEDYKDSGFSHYATDHTILKQFKNIEFISEDKIDLKAIIYSGKPTYVNLKR